MPRRAECEDVIRQLWPFLDGYVSEENRARITAHVEGCEACRSHFDYAAAFLTAVAAVEPSPRIDMHALEQRVVRALTRVG